MYERLKKSLNECPVVSIGEYQYFGHPVTDGIPLMDPALLREILDGILAVGDFDCDCILAPEAMGIPLAVPLSLELGIPYNVIRKKRYGLPGEVHICQHTGYARSKMYKRCE
jgi:adenine phosphoribosyltransferase